MTRPHRTGRPAARAALGVHGADNALEVHGSMQAAGALRSLGS